VSGSWSEATLSSVDTQIEVAIRSLRNVVAQQPTAELAVLIDPVVVNPFSDTQFDQQIASYRLPIRYEDLSNENLPYLLWVPDETRHERFINLSVRVAIQEAFENRHSGNQARSVCGWLLGMHPGNAVNATMPKSVAQHLGKQAIARRPETGERCLFRFFDPRVMETLALISTQEQLATVLGPIRTWCFVDNELAFRSIEVQAESQTSHLSFDADQWARLSRLEWVNQLLPRAADWGITGSRLDNSKRIDAALARAQACGLATDSDCFAYAACYFCVHPRFDEHPRFVAILRDSQLVGFSDHVAALGEAVLDEVAAGTWLQP
jgi:hypothetical protein